MDFYFWKPRPSSAQRRKTAERLSAGARKAAGGLSPVAASRRAIANTFWGRAWCGNLERYSDFANRLPRGRSYLRSGSVIDLQISEGKVQAQVVGSRLYEVVVQVAAVPKRQWKLISADCSGSIDSLVELLQGRLSQAVMERICTPNTGLFPAPKDIQFSCSCPDWAFMCKHIAAALYGVAVRLDEQPELIFTLRRVDAKELVMQAGSGLARAPKAATAAKVLDGAVLGDVFGIEMATTAPQKLTAKAGSKTAVNPGKATTGRAKNRRKSTVRQDKAIIGKPVRARAVKKKGG